MTEHTCSNNLTQHTLPTYHCYCSVFDESKQFVENCFVSFKDKEQLENAIHEASGIYEKFKVFYIAFNDNKSYDKQELRNVSELSQYNSIYLDAYAQLQI